ncbi:MAG: hypothetical protein ABW019_02725 [Chitinophagaceae bacterium]
MFRFFTRKDETTVTDIVWMTMQAKWNGIVQGWEKEQPVVLCWFDATLQQLRSLPDGKEDFAGSLFLADHFHTAQLQGRPVLFAEHYPLRSKETALFGRLPVREITVHSALEEPLFRNFGGDRLIHTMQQMGMQPEESVSHTLISRSIRNAQEKIEKKIATETPATSAAQWFDYNQVH